MDVFRALPALPPAPHAQRESDPRGPDSPRVSPGDPPQLGPCGLAIGNFDGVHLGHQAIVKQLKSVAAPLPVIVMTFEPHPREFFARRRSVAPPARISTDQERLDALQACGVDAVCIVPFDEKFSTMPANEFIESVISERLAARHVMVGDDFRFGAHRQGDFAMLSEYSVRHDFTLHQMPTLTREGKRVSSSLVREALKRGDFATVADLLGRPYRMSGEVIRGKQLGRTLGFPTLNIALPFAQPALSGVFVVQVEGLGRKPLPGVASLGVRPAVESQGEYLLEVHLFDFNETVYGKPIKVEFLRKLRDEENYDSLELLKKQIATDAREARAYFAS